MTLLHLTGNEPMVRRIVAATYPQYRGRKYRLRVAERVNAASYWDGGSRSYFVFLDLATMEARQAPAQSAFDQEVKGLDVAPLGQNVVCVEHKIFCGRDMGITIHVHPNEVAPLLPANTAVSDCERIVLYATRCYKSSYGGVRDYRYHQAVRATGITRAQWDDAIASLQSIGMLRKNKSITPKGRNAVSGLHRFPALVDEPGV